ncbi:MAG: dihydrodipicolinate synthase family protein [Acidobacteria bacterium]|nr:dihydrodipicolinate synthase family protein [Acidobacteriota bacterium]MBI3657816.1 dihydrodipicolinate synthase family protein [Acidobacteriota bacterium]
MDLRGILPPVATPFDPLGEIDIAALVSNLRRWQGTGLAGYVLLGSTSETVYLTEAERARVLEAARSVIPSDQLMISGVIYEATGQAIAFSKAAAALGVNYVLVGAPNYYKDRMTEAVLHAFYTEVAEHSPTPVLLYNVPQFTGVSLSPNLIAKLSEHPNIVGMKDSSGNMAGLSEILRRVVAPFPVFVGAPFMLLPSLVLGAVGGILGIAHFAPRLCVELFQACTRRDFLQARTLHFQLAPAMAVTAAYGVPAIKAAMDMLGYVGGPCRRPLQPVDETTREIVKQALSAAKLL